MRRTESFVALVLCLTFGSLADTLLPLTNGAPQTMADLWADFDPRAEPLEVDILHAYEQDGVTLQVVRYRVGIFGGKKAMVAAVYGYPTGQTDLPALLNIHGGGQFATANACYRNAQRGYATLSVAWAGRINAQDYFVNNEILQVYQSGDTDNPGYKVTTDWVGLDQQTGIEPRDGAYDDVASPRNSAWFLWAMAARRGLTFLEQQPEVDGDRLGVYGHSMGGKLTVMTAGTDARVKAAAPSCGGVSDRKADKPLYDTTIGDANYLSGVRCPIFFLSPANDFHSNIDDVPQAIREVTGNDWRVSHAPHHNHQDTAKYTVPTLIWMDQHLKGGAPVPPSPQIQLTLNPGTGVPKVTVTGSTRQPVRSVEVYYTQQGEDAGEAQQSIWDCTYRHWHSPAVQGAAGTWTANLPLHATTEPLWVYASITYALDGAITGAGYYYNDYTADAFVLSSVMQQVPSGELQAAGATATMAATPLIEAFEGDWRREWFTYSNDPSDWAVTTHKVNDPVYAAPKLAKLSLQVRSAAANTLQLTMNREAVAAVALAGGPEWQTVELLPMQFVEEGKPWAADFSGAKELRLSSGSSPEWAGAAPEFRNLRWAQATQEAYDNFALPQPQGEYVQRNTAPHTWTDWATTAGWYSESRVVRLPTASDWVRIHYNRHTFVRDAQAAAQLDLFMVGGANLRIDSGGSVTVAAANGFDGSINLSAAVGQGETPNIGSISIESGGSLTSANTGTRTVLDGDASERGSLTLNGGTFTAQGSAHTEHLTLRNSHIQLNGGTFDMTGGQTQPDGVVFAINGKGTAIDFWLLNNARASSEYRFSLGPDGVSTVNVTGWAHLSQAKLVVDGKAYTGGAREITLFETPNLASTIHPANITVTNFPAWATVTVEQDAEVSHNVILHITGEPGPTPNDARSQVDAALQKRIAEAMSGTAPATPAQPRKLLVLSKAMGAEQASIPAGMWALDAMGRRSGAFSVEFSDTSAAYAYEKLQAYDAVVLNNSTRIERFLTTPELQQGLIRYVVEGGGLVGIHGANDGGWPAFTDLIGGRSVSHPWHAGGAWDFVVEDSGCGAVNHYAPLFRFQDEIYAYEDFDRTKVRVILALDMGSKRTAAAAPKFEDVPVAWIRQYGQGRLFYTTLGHRIETWHDADFLAHLFAGIQVATGDLPADFTPIAEKPASPHRAKTRPLAEAEALKTFEVQDGYQLELVAGDSMVNEPVSIAWDGDGAMYVLQMDTYMQDALATGENEPTSRVIKLVDTDWDGVMDQRTIFADGLVLPRKIICLDGEVIIGETNTKDLYAYRDTDGDGVSDTKRLVYQGGKQGGNMEHQPQGLVWNIDNRMDETYHSPRYRYQDDKVVAVPGEHSGFHGQWGLSQDVAGQQYCANGGPEKGVSGFQQPHAYGSMTFADERPKAFLTVWPRDNIPDTQGGLGRLRDDNTLNHFTGAAGLEVYRGGTMPELDGDIFIGEPVGRLIRRAKVENRGGKRIVHNVYEQTEFIRSTDPNFRPVYLATGPDGSLYLVDMYRGIIQQAVFATPGTYLYRINSVFGLDKNIGRGRIYRVRRTDTPTYPQPRMLQEPASELVQHLAHANAWWRLTAQKLIVVRQDASVVPALVAMARQHENPLARLHALWTLDGLHASEWWLVEASLRDADPRVRAASLRLAEPFLRDDASRIAALPPMAAETDSQALIQRYNTLRRLELTSRVEALVAHHAAQHEGLAAIHDARETWRLAVEARRREQEQLAAEEKAFRAAGETHYQSLCLSCHAADGMGTRVGTVTLGAPLKGSPRVVRDNPDRLIALALKGLQGPLDGKTYGVMMPLETHGDQYVAEVLSYIRRAWGNGAAPIAPEQVAAIRENLTDQTESFTQQTLSERYPALLNGKENWKLQTNIVNQAKAKGYLVDGLLKSRWSTNTAMKQGHWIRIELPDVETITGFVMNHGTSTDDFPRAYRLDVSLDGEAWSAPITGHGTPGRTSLTIPPTKARFVRITCRESFPLFWSIHELDLYVLGPASE